jgi:transposase, IS30 family
MRSVAEALGRAPSTISRELRRECGVRGYAPVRAHRDAAERARRPKQFKLEGNGPLAREVADRLRRRWSPQQIANRLRRDHPEDPRWHVSAESIYASLFVDARGGLGDELRAVLRSGQTRRSVPKRTGRILDKTMIWDRPAEARSRAVPGHWEGDLLLPGDGRSAIMTLVERSTRLGLLVALPEGRGSEAVKDALVDVVSRLPEHLRRSLTWDQGNEMARHIQFTMATDVAVYFCEPGRPQQRGTNENFNRLVRQYYPKNTSFTGITQDELDQVAEEINSRPREMFNWDTPAERFEQAILNGNVASTT